MISKSRVLPLGGLWLLLSCGPRGANQNVVQTAQPEPALKAESEMTGLVASSSLLTLAELNALNLPVANWSDNRELAWELVGAAESGCPNLDVDGNGRVEGSVYSGTGADGAPIYKGDAQIIGKYILLVRQGITPPSNWTEGNALKAGGATRSNLVRYLSCLQRKNILDFNNNGQLDIGDAVGIMDAAAGHTIGPGKTLQSALRAEEILQMKRVCLGFTSLNGTVKSFQIKCSGEKFNYRLPDAEVKPEGFCKALYSEGKLVLKMTMCSF